MEETVIFIRIEPSSAVPFGALISNQLDVSGKKIGIIISGGNVDFSKFFENFVK